MTYVNNDFEDLMKNRRSIREYDETVKISQEEMKAILEDAVTAPSSVNMQPWRFVVVESDAGKEKLSSLVRFNTRQNESSSAMIDPDYYDRCCGGLSLTGRRRNGLSGTRRW